MDEIKLTKEQRYEETLKLLQIPVEDVENQETPDDELPIGKYGILARNYLKEHHSARYTFLVLEAEIDDICRQVDREANEMMETLQAQLRAQTTDPKGDFMAAVQYKTMIRDQAEEVVLNEIVYKRR